MGKYPGKYTESIFLALSICLIPGSAGADIGVPMIAVTLPWIIITLIPVVLIEAYILRRRHDLSFKRSAMVMSIANCFSALIGIPVTWCILAGIQMLTGGGRSFGLDTVLDRFLAVTWQAPWLIPYESELYWMIPVAFIVLSVPYFLSSWLLETLIARKFIKEIPTPLLRRSVLVANLASYILIDVTAVLYLLHGF